MKEQKNTLFNITKYLLDCYKKNIEPSPDLMSSVDFSEVSTLKIFYTGLEGQSIHYDIKESLAQNCLTNIPFEAYQKYITADWLNFSENDEGILNSAIYHQNTRFIEKMHLLGFEEAQKNSDFSRTYERTFIRPILKVDRVFFRTGKNDFNESFLNSYHQILQDVSDERKFLSQFNFIGKEIIPFKKSKKKNWVETACFENYVAQGSYANTIIASLVTKDLFKDMLADALAQILSKNKNKTNISTILGFTSKNDNSGSDVNTLQVAMKNRNMEATSLLIETLELSPQKVRDTYDEFLRDALNGYNKRLGFENLFSKEEGQFYLELKNKYFPGLESKLSPLFMFSKDESLKEKTKDNHHILNEPFAINLKTLTTMNDLLLLSKIFNDFLVQWRNRGDAIGLPSDNSSDNNRISTEFTFARYLIQNEKSIVENVDLRAIGQDKWDKLELFLAQVPDFAKIVKKEGERNKSLLITSKDLKTWFDVYKLETLLPEKQGVKMSRVKI